MFDEKNESYQSWESPDSSDELDSNGRNRTGYIILGVLSIFVLVFAAFFLLRRNQTSSPDISVITNDATSDPTEAVPLTAVPLIEFTGRKTT